jgi:hypothetical protein
MYQREAADRLTRQRARGSLRVHTPLSVTLRLRLSAWLYALAARLSSETADAARTLDLGGQALCHNGVEYWLSA